MEKKEFKDKRKQWRRVWMNSTWTHFLLAHTFQTTKSSQNLEKRQTPTIGFSTVFTSLQIDSFHLQNDLGVWFWGSSEDNGKTHLVFGALSKS